MKAPELVIAARITYRQLDYWTRSGYLTAERRDHQDSGYEREWPDEQVELAIEMARLVRAGLTPEAAHAAATQLQVYGRAVLGLYEIGPAPTCQLCDDPLPLEAWDADVHEDCLEHFRQIEDMRREDEDAEEEQRQWWRTAISDQPTRQTEDVPDHEGRFS